MQQENSAKNGVTGTAMLVHENADAATMKNEVDELKELTPLNAAINAGASAGDIVFHPAGSRGLAQHGWLESRQTFSFADYYNPDCMHFGVLRVLNDDWIAPGKGFGRHPHDNMEIISIPLDGALKHADSMNNTAVIKKGDIQAMSAGTGIFHTEYNNSETESASFLQIWLFPREKNVAPRYDQRTLDASARNNRFQQILSPGKEDEGVWINQDAWFHLGNFDGAKQETYGVKKAGNGVYAFLISGEATIQGQPMTARDGLGIWNTAEINIKTGQQGAEILLMDIPMVLS